MAPARTTASSRPKSPILTSSGELVANGPETNKINRVALAREANCEVIFSESPSAFWIRLSNHITDSEYLKPRKLEPIQLSINSLRFKYVFAPRQLKPSTTDKTHDYRRARVLRTISVNGEDLVLVHFIDFGDRSWVGAKSLAHMDNEYYFHPWQAIGCCLMAVAPKASDSRALDSNQQPMWTDEEAAAFRQVLEQFTDTKVEVNYGSVESNDSRAMIKVNLFGRLKSAAGSRATTTPEPNGQETKPQLESIGTAFARKCPRTVAVSRGMLDAHKQYQYEAPVSAAEMTPPDPATLAAWQLTLDEMVDDAVVYPSRSHLALWSNERNPEARGTQIPLVTLKWLEDNGYINRGHLLIHVEGACTVSPYEFYARPLKDNLVQLEGNIVQLGNVGSDNNPPSLVPANTIIDANKEIQEFVDKLNTFYGEPVNRQCIDQQAVLHALSNGDRAYGMVERTDDVAQFTGSWQRVEVIARQEHGAVNTILVRVRYLDAGGTDIKQLDSIFEIHPDHAERPPFCIQFSLFGLLPKQADGYRRSDRGGFESAFGSQNENVSYKWSVAAKEAFKTLLREDVPLSANMLHGRLNKLNDEQPVIYSNEEPYKRPNVIFVSDLIVRAESSSNSQSIDTQLVNQGHATLASHRSVPVEYWELLDSGIDFHT
uniref:Tudor domain-containing protein n=1 Tax=Plectus sambesii TaxID=2011161 RepID=A0A914UNZ1_9BILA